MRLNVKEYFRFNHLMVIAFIYYFGKIFGLLPIQYFPAPKVKKLGAVEMGEFRSCKVGIALSLTQFAIEAWTCYVVFKYLLESAMLRTEALCSQGNYCSAFGLLLSHTVIAILVVAIVPIRHKKTISCFNQANYILFNGRRPLNLLNSYFITILFVISILVKLIISNIGFDIRQPELFYPYNLAYFGPLIIINIVGVLCSVGESAYHDINSELEELCSSKLHNVYRVQRIRALMEHHWRVTNFVEHISTCFSLDILLVMIDIYIQVVLFLYVTLWAMFAQKVFSGLIWPHVAGLLEVSIITIKLVYLCDRCNRTVAKGNVTILFLQHLSSVLPFDSNAQEQIKIFTLKVNCRDTGITASGFFTINLTLLVRIIGVVLTYFLVLIQFQVEGETSLDNRTTSAKICSSWPCLKPA